MKVVALLLSLLLLACAGGPPPDVYAVSVGKEARIPVVLSGAEGVSGFTLKLSASGPARISGVYLTPGIGYTMSEDKVVSAVDLRHYWEPPEQDYTLLRILVTGVSPGPASLVVEPLRVDDDGGHPIAMPRMEFSLEVR